MSQQKPGTPKGTRDFGPEVMVKRNYILDTIKATYKKFGYLPLETPAMENLSVLTGKYGDEGDQLIFKILNSGDYLSKVKEQDIAEGSKSLSFKISDKALRYDLTVPFARYVVLNQHEITFPFKRYQIQPVWRADRPQKGRYREFYQCDADVVGTNSLLCEAEIILMINEALQNLGINDFSIKINNRKVLMGMAEYVGAKGKEADLFVAIDKLDKIGPEKVKAELESKGFSSDAWGKLETLFNIQSTASEKLDTAATILETTSEGKKGLEELQEVLTLVKDFSGEENFNASNWNIDFDFTLARGLSYYTGAIFEVKVNNVQIGSISGGGRYDDLTGVFGLKDVSGVGFSFGIDRVFDVMEELNLFPASTAESTKVLICNFDTESEKKCLPLLTKLRAAGINSEIYPESAKLKKQMNYANKKSIPYVLLIGSEELKSGQLTLKDMTSGEQTALTINEVIEKLK